MKKSLIFLFMALPLFAWGQLPLWTQDVYRELNYPAAEWYTGFVRDKLKNGNEIGKALNLLERDAQNQLAESIIVKVEGVTRAENSSMLFQQGNRSSEQITTNYQQNIRTATTATTVKSEVKSYHDTGTGMLYAFSAVRKTDLIAYYGQQIALYLNKVDAALQTADELAKKGYKMKARKECENVIEAFSKVFYAQDLLTAINGNVEDNTLQQSRSERLRNALVQTMVDLENSIYIYLECDEMVNGQSVVHIADRLPGLMTENGCGCNFIDLQEEADYVIKVSARLARCNDAPDNVVFCYANATVSVYNVRTQKTLMPKIAETKGGWTNKNRAKATEEAFDELADKIAEKVLPMIKN